MQSRWWLDNRGSVSRRAAVRSIDTAGFFRSEGLPQRAQRFGPLQLPSSRRRGSEESAAADRNNAKASLKGAVFRDALRIFHLCAMRAYTIKAFTCPKGEGLLLSFNVHHCEVCRV